MTSTVVNASQRSKKSEAETTAVVEAEVDEAIATCGGDVPRLCARPWSRTRTWRPKSNHWPKQSQRDSRGGRMRKAPQRITKV